MLQTKLKKENEADRLDTYMTAGNKIREKSQRGDTLALHAVLKINRQSRKDFETVPLGRVAYVLHSLKHPEEVASLRRIYGPGFFLIGLYCTDEERLKYLTENKNIDKDKARHLMKRDEQEETSFGQKTRKAFSLSDVFIRHNLTNLSQTQEELWRFLDLVFGHPYITPEKDEYGMYLAYSASLRSGSLSRQVGAAILSAEGDLIATGVNDVPCAKGGLYWPGNLDNRDHKKGYDSNDFERKEIIEDVVNRLFSSVKRPEDYIKKLKGSRIDNITEYGRAVHAEMEALLSCTRNGVSPRGGTLYTTTFPCHNCAKHIIAAGIKRVIYVEPYPKSLATELYSDEVAIEEPDAGDKVKFEPFIGIGARRYVDLFSMGWSSGYEIKRKTLEGRTVDWKREKASMRVPMVIFSYIDIEKAAIKDLDNLRIHFERRDDANGTERCQ